MVNKQVVKMENDDGNLVFLQDEILGEVLDFYRGLYSEIKCCGWLRFRTIIHFYF